MTGMGSLYVEIIVLSHEAFAKKGRIYEVTSAVFMLDFAEAPPQNCIGFDPL